MNSNDGDPEEPSLTQCHSLEHLTLCDKDYPHLVSFLRSLALPLDYLIFSQNLDLGIR